MSFVQVQGRIVVALPQGVVDIATKATYKLIIVREVQFMVSVHLRGVPRVPG